MIQIRYFLQQIWLIFQQNNKIYSLKHSTGFSSSMLFDLFTSTLTSFAHLSGKYNIWIRNTIFLEWCNCLYLNKNSFNQFKMMTMMIVSVFHCYIWHCDKHNLTQLSTWNACRTYIQIKYANSTWIVMHAHISGSLYVIKLIPISKLILN